MSKFALVFPGQGSQAVGMGKDLYDNFPEIKALYDSADKILGMPISRLCFEGPDEELRLTANTQPALFLTSIACLRLLEKKGIKADVTAGHSVGEYAALVAAGAVDFEHALPLVRKRGEIMTEVGAAHEGTMAAIIGLDDDKVKEVCAKASGEGVVEIANYNSPGQVVISGEVKAVEAAIILAKEAGARMVMPLKVSGGFHSSLMLPAVPKLSVELAKTPFRDAVIPVVANATADYVRTVEEIKSALEKQLAGSVYWTKSISRMAEDGVDRFIEVGPGKVLSGLIKRTIGSVEIKNVGDIASLEAL